jgi:hypothetical protein
MYLWGNEFQEVLLDLGYIWGTEVEDHSGGVPRNSFAV